MKRVSLLVANNPYGTTVSFAKGLYAAFKKIDIEPSLEWVSDGQFYHVLKKWEMHPPDATLSFSDVQMGGLSLSAFSPFKHYSLLVDPVIYFLHHFQYDHSLVTCVDRADIELITILNRKPPLFLPHAADGNYVRKERERIFPYVFFGTCIDYRRLEQGWSQRFGQQDAIRLKEISRRALFTEHSIAQVLMESKTPPEMFIPFYLEVDQYVRGRERVELLSHFHDVQIWGSGPWKEYFPSYQVHAAIPFEKTIEVMEQAYVVLNTSTRFKEASHERILYALLAGAVPLTTANPYLKKNFSQGEDLLLFERGGWYGALEIVNEAVSRREEIARAGEIKVRKAHLWEHRALDLLSHI